MQSISGVLTKYSKVTAKNNLLTQAFLFSQVKNCLQSFCSEQFPMLLEDFGNCRTFVVSEPDKIRVKICSKDNMFLTFLKTEKINLENCLRTSIINKIKSLEDKSIQVEIFLG